MSAQSGRSIPWLIAAVAITIMVPGTGLSLAAMMRAGSTWPLVSNQGLLQLSTPLFALLGALIASRKPGHSLGWLFLATGFCTSLNAISTGYSAYQPLDLSGRLPPLAFLSWLNRWIWLSSVALPTIFVFLLFPDGRLPSRRWTPVALCATLGLTLATLSLMIHPNPGGPLNWGQTPIRNQAANPILEGALSAGFGLMVIGSLGSLLAMGLRFRRSRGVERVQMKWLVLAMGIAVFGAGVAFAIPPLLPGTGDLAERLGWVTSGVGVLAIPVAVGIAILRHGLYDIDLIINRTLVYATLSAAVAGVYLGIVGGLGVLFQTSGNLGLSLLGVGTVAIIVQPVRDRLQRAVNHLMYGKRDDPYAVLSGLIRRLEGTLAPDEILPRIVETVSQTLKLPYTAIALAMPSLSQNSEGVFPIVAAYGSPTADALQLPLVYQAETIGTLIVCPHVGDSFSTSDHRLLEDLARQAGVAVFAVRLTTELQHSRQRLVTTREEERRRLRRDLHDGLGSQLAALHLGLDTLRTLIPKEAAAARSLAIDLRDEIHGTIADIRRLVYELRPPALDELGLAGAMRSLAAQSSSTNGLQVTVDVPEQLPPLPAAVEVAAYRIVQEALTNVTRHAQASSCVIRLNLGKDLDLQIMDDGLGMPAAPRAGVGLRSMRERAAELGGTCIANNAPGAGAQILVHLPLPAGKE
jgi:signal transduction histidine kinase